MKKKIVITFISFLTLPFIFWNITFGFLVGYILSCIFSYGIYSYYKSNKAKWLGYSILIGFVIYIFMLPITLNVMNTKTASYQERISLGKDLSIIEKWNVYGINLAACIVAFPVVPEAAMEMGLMMFPCANEERVFDGSFFMNSQVVQNAIKSGKATGLLQWYQKHYNITHSESRIAIALNMSTYEIKGDSIYIKTPIRYPKKCRSTFISYPVTIRIEEGLFRYLDEEGWLFGYDAYWKAKID